MTIQIDDAGWGSLVGGVLIGACRKESPQTQHAFQEIPVGAFQGASFQSQAYLPLAATAAEALMEDLHVNNSEAIEICTGYVLDAAYTRLRDLGHNVQRTKIGDPLQTLLEEEFLRRVQALGVNTDYEVMTQAQGLYFWQCVRWLKGGNVENPAPAAEREKQCKTGWSTYPIWAYNAYSKAKGLAKAHKQQRSRW